MYQSVCMRFFELVLLCECVMQMAAQRWNALPDEFTDIYTLGTETVIKSTPETGRGTVEAVAKQCLKMNGRLMVVKNEKDDLRLKEHIQKDTARIKGAAMGLFIRTKDNFVWINGVPLRKDDYKHWAPGQPDFKTECAFCTEAWIRAHKYGWNDLRCYAKLNRRGACEYRKESSADNVVGIHITHTAPYEFGSVPFGNLIEGVILFHQGPTENIIDVRGVLLFKGHYKALPKVDFWKIVITSQENFCILKGRRKLPTNLAFEDLDHNMGQFPFVDVVPEYQQRRMDIVRYLPGKASDLIGKHLLFLLPDSTIIGCVKIQRKNRSLFEGHNKALYDYFNDAKGKFHIKPDCNAGKVM